MTEGEDQGAFLGSAKELDDEIKITQLAYDNGDIIFKATHRAARELQSLKNGTHPEMVLVSRGWGHPRNFSINGYDLIMTCSSSPEQYDVFKDGEMAGYLRLRYGVFSARYPNVEGQIVYHYDLSEKGYPEGKLLVSFTGEFPDGESRRQHLHAAIDAIHKAAQEKKNEPNR